MKIHTEPAYYANIYMAGDIDQAKRVCVDYCWNIGLCVTVTATEYIYTGGRETGFVVGLLNYPRFPAPPAEIDEKASTLAQMLMRELCQWSALIPTPTHAHWLTRRDDPQPSVSERGKDDVS